MKLSVYQQKHTSNQQHINSSNQQHINSSYQQHINYQIPTHITQQTINTRFQLKPLNQLIQSKSKQSHISHKSISSSRFPHLIYQNAIKKTQIYLQNLNPISTDLLKSLQKSQSKSGISLKSKQKINPILSSQNSCRATTSSIKKQKLSIIAKLKNQIITPFQQTLQKPKPVNKQFQSTQRKQNISINSNINDMTPIKFLNEKQFQLQQKINNNQPIIYSRRPLKTTRQIITNKMQKYQEKKKVKIDKKSCKQKYQSIRV